MKAFLEAQRFTVKVEIHNFDIAAIRGDELLSKNMEFKTAYTPHLKLRFRQCTIIGLHNELTNSHYNSPLYLHSITSKTEAGH